MPRRLLVGCLLLLGVARAAGAQGGAQDEASQLILLTGARTMGMGQAGVASALGAEALLWNPALIARARRELSLSTVSGVPIPESDLNLTAVYSLPRLFTVAFSWRYLGGGVQPAGLDTIQTGSFVPTSSTFAAAFAAPFGDRLAVGVEAKVLRLSFDCTGTCPNQPLNPPLTGAIDVGVQYILTKDSVITLAAAVRNVGLPLQFNDSPQADQLPSRIAIGAEYAPKLSQYPTVRVRGGTEIVSRPSGEGGLGVHVGGEVSWLDRYHGRAGYVHNGVSGSGPTVGAGASFTRWRVDFAQFFSEFAAEAGSRPTYLSFRYLF